MQYKCVRGTIHFSVTNSNEIDDMVASIADLINRETVGGWEYDSMFPLTITKNHANAKGLKARFDGWADTMSDGEYTINVYVFRKP